MENIVLRLLTTSHNRGIRGVSAGAFVGYPWVSVGIRFRFGSRNENCANISMSPLSKFLQGFKHIVMSRS